MVVPVSGEWDAKKATWNTHPEWDTEKVVYSEEFQVDKNSEVKIMLLLLTQTMMEQKQS